MKYELPKMLLNEKSRDIDDYNALELLGFYRSAKCLPKELIKTNNSSQFIKMCGEICYRVDSIINAMMCSNNYKIVIMAKILTLEYCNEPMDSMSKIIESNVSKTTYYQYLKEAKLIFISMDEQVHKTSNDTSNSND